MYLIVGLGNPDKEYLGTRHNAGFQAIDLLSNKYKIDVNRLKFKGTYGEGNIAGEKVMFLKPLTYMNLSGESVGEAVKFYKIPSKNIIILHDDISIEVGRMRIRAKGSAGGHNGLKSIISSLSSEEFVRIKIGVGQPKGDIVGHVLGRFSKDETLKLGEIYEVVPDAIETIIKSGTETAMNKFNGLIP